MMKITKLTLALSALTAINSANAHQESQRLFKPLDASVQVETNISHGHEHKNLHDRAPVAHTPTRSMPLLSAKHTPLLQAMAVSQSEAIAACDLNSLASASSSQIVTEIKQQGTSCINALFSADSSIQTQVFTSDKMYAAAQNAKSLSQSYSGNGSADLETLYLFIRAGFYVEFYNDQVTFATWVKPAVKDALDAFVGNSHFYDDNDAHGKVLGEAITTMDSSELQGHYLPVVKAWLSKWNESYAQKWNMRSAVNGIFTILYRGQWNDNFVALVKNDQQLVSLLGSFTAQTWMVNSDSEYLIINAASELARLKLYNGAAIQESVDTQLTALFSRYNSYGFGDGVWLAAADVATYYADCGQFGICNFDKELESKVLSQQHSCSDTIKIRAQALTAQQLTSACQTMEAEEGRFHTMLETGRLPVADDNNDFLQVNIFNSSADYKKYAKAIFKISTDNGGMYLEGNPSDVNNVANFVAYEASYAKPDHYIWNLEHEYVHYLDGRFDLYGDFNAPTKPIVWWSEGVAEYIANLNDNQAAIDTIKDGSVYTLAEIFSTTYDGFDQDRIYRWGYLGVRFLYEKHLDEVLAMRQETRQANWNAYQARMDRLASQYQSEFVQWCNELAAGGQNNAPTSEVNGPYSGDVNQAILFSSQGSVDPDGDVLTYLWRFGDGSQSNEANPTHSYVQAGEYQISLTVSDPSGLNHTSNTVATVSATTSNKLQSGVPVAVAGEQDEQVAFSIDVAAGTDKLVISTSGGTGDADLYLKLGSAPTFSEYDCRPYQSGNEEVCEITTPAAGTYYIMLHGYNRFENVQLLGEIVTNSTIEDVCQSQGSVSNGRLAADETICLGSQEPMWFSLENVSGQQSVVIKTAHGSGDLGLEYSNAGWPNGTNVDASSFNQGNQECIEISAQSEYWGYLKVSGAPMGAALKVSYNKDGCQ
ncbi:collagenase [Pseudoalteromonas maricaloris]|uniref:collagenase n=1 Tax=Pseudoalteromonas maricaloris TaxID=184924 RepID=UPI00057E3345|nr:collagenase [Pseudoalteromonas flavipulchra]KID34483.1 peptidase M9 [Pseudoalteromonas flavipulchra NCIMB 2033 = ATCC BAA-314]MBD0781614.1 PKD domain-containing protein [Pseudoalteromonas flavipulchra]